MTWIPLKTIPGFPDYAITKEGSVWSKRRGIWLKPQNGSSGYKFVVLSVNGRKDTRLIHRLILETYIGFCPQRKESRHLDGDKQNNRLGNLCWGTPQENQADKIRHGTATHGERCNWAKLTEYAVRMIVYTYRTRLFSQWEVALQYDTSRATVSDILRRKSWSHLWMASARLRRNQN